MKKVDVIKALKHRINNFDKEHNDPQKELFDKGKKSAYKEFLEYVKEKYEEN